MSEKIRKIYEFEKTLVEAMDKAREIENIKRVEQGKKPFNEVEWLSNFTSNNLNKVPQEETGDGMITEEGGTEQQEPDLKEEPTDDEKATENRDVEE